MSFLRAMLICLSVHATSFAAEIPKHVATTPVAENDPDWRERFESLNERSKDKDTQLAFVGDSITQMWEMDDAGKPTWKKFWVPLKVANFGVSGDRTENVLWRLENGNLDGLNPKLIVLHIGTNNAGQQYESESYKCTAQQTADGIQAIIAKLKAKCPRAKILLMAILPRGEEETDRVRKQNEETNGIIKSFADGATVFFLDVGQKFLKPNGDGNVTIQPDMLHLSAKGYQIWADAIYPTVRELMQ